MGRIMHGTAWAEMGETNMRRNLSAGATRRTRPAQNLLGRPAVSPPDVAGIDLRYRTVPIGTYTHFAKYAAEHEIEHSAFMVECREAGIEMFYNDYFELPEDRGFGDLVKQEHFHNYRMSRDKQALSWVYENSGGIEYVFFVGVDCAEIIRVDSIPSMLLLLPQQYYAKAGMTVEVAQHAGVSVGEKKLVDGFC